MNNIDLYDKLSEHLKDTPYFLKLHGRWVDGEVAIHSKTEVYISFFLDLDFTLEGIENEIRECESNEVPYDDLYNVLKSFIRKEKINSLLCN